MCNLYKKKKLIVQLTAFVEDLLSNVGQSQSSVMLDSHSQCCFDKHSKFLNFVNDKRLKMQIHNKIPKVCITV